MILIPMMGRSSRFFKQGYTVPKFQLPLAGRTVFDWVLESFRGHFQNESFLFVVRTDFDTAAFVKKRAGAAGVVNFRVLELDGETSGQADTVSVAIASMNDEEKEQPLTVFNADSFLISYVPLSSVGRADGVVEVFRGEGEHWSFVEPGPANSVLRTTEKERISDLCSNGLYYFRNSKVFAEGFDQMLEKGGTVKGEYYVAPLYNYLIELGYQIDYRLADSNDCVFCGVPDEYEELLNREWAGF